MGNQITPVDRQCERLAASSPAERSFRHALVAACVVFPLAAELQMLCWLLRPVGELWTPPSPGRLLTLSLHCMLVMLGNMRSGMVYLLPGLLLARWLVAARPGAGPLLRALSAVALALLNFFALGAIACFLTALRHGCPEQWVALLPRDLVSVDYLSLSAALLYYVYAACLPEPARRLCRHPLRALRALLGLLPKLMVGCAGQGAAAAVPAPAPVPLHLAPVCAAAVACVVVSPLLTVALNTLAGEYISWLSVGSYMVAEPLLMLCPWLLLGQVVAQLPRRGGRLRVGGSCVCIALGVLWAGMEHVDPAVLVDVYKSDILVGDRARTAALLHLLLLDVLYVLPPLLVGLVSHVRLLRRLQPSVQPNQSS